MKGERVYAEVPISDENANFRRYPMLHSLWKYACIEAWVVFILFQAFIGCDHLFSSTPICSESDSQFPMWYFYSYVAIFTGFAVVLLTMLGKIVQSEQSNDMPSYLIYFHIVALSTVGTMLSLIFGWGGVCSDILGVSTPAAMWGEWFACAPLLLISVLGAQDKRKLARMDWILLFLFVAMLVSGFCVNLVKTAILGQVVLTISIICYSPFFFLPIFLRSDNEETFGSDSSYKRKRYILTMTFVLGMPIFGLVYLLAAARVINAPQTVIMFQMLSLVVKALYAAVLMDLYQGALIAAQQALAEERLANDSRRSFLKYLFHEVRSPLNSLTMGIEILERNSSNLGEEANESLVMMRGASEFMASTLNDVLSMQKIEEGKLDLEMMPFSLLDAVTKVFSTFRGAAISKALRFRPNIASDVPVRLLGDRFRIEHVIANLLSNAVKFSPHGGVVTVSGVKTEEYSRNGKEFAVITVSVKDEGPGISQEDQEKLFGEFVQINAASLQQGGGSGLGLSICKQILTLHHGTIGVRSELGQGCLFYFSIPFEVLPPLSSRNVSNASSLHGASMQGQRNIPVGAQITRIPPESYNIDMSPLNGMIISGEVGTVLVVDDTESNRKMLRLLLKNCGIAAEVAENGQAAVNMVLEDINKFSIIFIDDQMPVMTGPEATKVLRKNGFDNLIVGVTGNVLDEDISAFLSAGVDLILSKPLRMNSLQLLLKHVQEMGCASHPRMTLVEFGNKLIWTQKDGQDPIWLHT